MEKYFYMFTLINKKLVYIFLFLIILVAGCLRIYKLSDNPPALSWDEVSVGYNAYSIANFGMDEWGKFLPVVFKSFGEYKNPVHVYFGALSVKALGLSDFSTRFPTVLFGILNVILIFYFVKKVFKSDTFALFSAFILAVSPYNIQFSRFNHELNFALFFFLLGLISFYETLNKKHFFAVSAFCFLVSFISYSAAKIFIPLFVIILFAIYFKEIKGFGKHNLTAIFVFVIFSILISFNPNLLGLERLKQTTLGIDEIKATQTFKSTNNVVLGRIELLAKNYSKHFNYKYLFVTGDSNPRHSIQSIGEFYKIETLFLIVGLFVMLYRVTKSKDKKYLILIVWGLLAPIPGSIGGEAPHAARAMFVNGGWHIISGYGLYTIITLIKHKFVKLLVVAVFFVIFSFEFKNYLKALFIEYSSRHAIEWQYGMKEISEYIKDNQSTYHSVYVTNVRQQPYIFLLYNLKYSPNKFSKSVVYNLEESKNSNLVLSFGKFNFKWDTVDSQPVLGVLYVLSPFEYSGLRFKDAFEVKKVIKYPNGGDAFYLISAKEEEYE